MGFEAGKLMELWWIFRIKVYVEEKGRINQTVSNNKMKGIEGTIYKDSKQMIRS